MKFIHAADSHLGSPFIGLTQQNKELARRAIQAGRAAFCKMIDTAIAEQVDCILLAGDIYDSTQQSVQEQLFVMEQFQRLQAAQILVFIIRGNHDFQLQKVFNVPENVYEFGEAVESVEFTTRNGERVAVSGFSYGTRWIFESKVAEFPKRSKTADYHLGIYHGEMRSEQQLGQAYAPFSLKDLSEKSYDYWALGHIHQREIIAQHPLAVYVGNLQGRSFKELGEKGFYLVTLQHLAEPLLKFIPASSLEWWEITTLVSDEVTLEEVMMQVWQKLQVKMSPEKEVIIRIRLQSLAHYDERWAQVILLQLQQWIQQEQLPLWVIEVKLDSLRQHSLEILPHIPLIQDQEKQQQHLREIEHMALQHAVIAQHFSDLWSDQEGQKMIQEQAEYLLSQWLMEEQNDYQEN